MEKIKRKQSLGKYISERIKTNIPMTVLMALYAAFCIGALIFFATTGHGRDCLIAVAYLIVIPIFYTIEYALKIRSPLPYTVFILVYCVFCFLGASFNFYTIIPKLDDILHACWGLLFTTLGFCVIKSLMGEPKNAKQFAAYLLFAVGFCMILSIIWEIYEYSCDSLMPAFDMQQDEIVDHIHSFSMYPNPLERNPDNLHTWRVEGIARTVLYDAQGNIIGEIPDGYLDIGLHDTMMDIIWCVIFTTAFCVFLAIDRKLGGKLYPHIVPVYVGNGKSDENNTSETEGNGEEQVKEEQEQTESGQSEDIEE